MLTAYEVITNLNEVSAEFGLKSDYPSQMGYNMMDKGRLPFIMENGKKRVTPEAAEKFILDWVSGKRTSSKVKFDLAKKILGDLKGEDTEETDEDEDEELEDISE